MKYNLRYFILLLAISATVILPFGIGYARPYTPIITQATELIGTLEGDVNVAKGSVSWSMGIDVPAGVNGISPSLSLDYHQSSSNGLLGIGFRLGGSSAVSRCPATKKYDDRQGGIKFDSDDRFCLDGQRLIAISGDAGDHLTEYRTATETYTKIISYGSQGTSGPQRWKVWTKDGVISDYGSEANARLTIAKENNAVLTWTISKQSDRFDNTVNYTYDLSSGAPLTKVINYSGNRVEFEYEGRSDELSAWQMGESRVLNKLLTSISVYSAGGLLRRYSLDYSQISSGDYSRLASVSMCVQGGSCTKPTEFTWKEIENNDESQQQIDLVDNTELSTYRFIDLNKDGNQDICYIDDGLYCAINDGTGSMSNLREWTSSLGSKWNDLELASSLVFTDLNRDTFPDYCVQDSTGMYCGLHNTGSSFSAGSYWTTEFKEKEEIRYFDLNDDKLQDICRIETNEVVCAYNTGSSYGNSFTLLNSGWGKGTEPNTSVAFIDIDGNGLTDLCGLDINGYRCALMDSRDDSGRVSFLPPIVLNSLPQLFGTPYYTWSFNVYSKTTSGSFRYSDLNADGLVDICLSSSYGSFSCAINTGSHFEAFSSWATITARWENTPNISDNNSGIDLKLFDINGDSRPDLCVNENYEFRCGINTGTGFSDLVKYSSLQYSQDVFEINGEDVAPKAAPISLTDIDGNGGIDVCYRSYAGISCALGANVDISLLTGVVTGYGNETKIEYGQISDPDLYQSDTDAQLPIIDQNGHRRIVKRVSTSDGIGGFNTIDYQYEGLKWHIDEGSLGYRKISRFNSANNRRVETVYHQTLDLNGQVKSSREFASANPNQADSLLQESIPSYEVTSSYDGQIKVIHTKTTVINNYDNDVLIKTEQVENQEYDAWGNVTNLVTINTANNEEKQTVITTQYSNNENRWLLGKPTLVTTEHSTSTAQNNIIRSTQFTYYPITGALKTEVTEPNTNVSLTTTFVYDGFGNRTQATVSAGGKSRSTATQYDSKGLYPLVTKNALNHQQITAFDQRCGVPKNSKGPNGLSTHWEYDESCRKTKEIRADGTTTTWDTNWSDGYDLGYGETNHSVYSITTQASGSSAITKWYDGLGREVRSQSVGFDGTAVYEDKVYQANGQIEKATLPYFEGEFPGDGTYWVRSDYDKLGRTIVQYKPSTAGDQETNYSYDGLSTTVTDPLGHSKTTTLNVFGKPEKVESSTGSIITYLYDAIGNVIETNTDGYIITMRYDSRGNKVRMTDPSMGIWAYRYNGLGELIWQKGAKSQVTTQQYDALGRMIKKVDASGTSSWKYDVGTKAIGKLYQEEKGQTSKTYTYDNLGRALKTITTIDGRSFESKVAYDQYSRVNKETYPDGMQTQRDYTPEGYLKRISIPKKDIYDYDYAALENTIADLVKEIAKLGREAAQSRSKYKQYMAQADKFRLIAQSAEFQTEETKAAALVLREQATYLSDLAEAHHRQSEHFSGLSDFYRQGIYKDLTFTSQQNMWSNAADGYVMYQTSVCTSRSSKGKCKSSHYFTVQISLEDFNNPECEKRIGKWASWCSYSVPQTLNLGQFYETRSNTYSNLADIKTTEAATATSNATSKEAQAQVWGNRAEQYKQRALAEIEKAKTETAHLSKVMAKINDYQGVIDGIQRSIDSRNDADALIVLWEAAGRDAAGRLRSDWVGNGLVTNREFDPYNGHLSKITTGIGNNYDLIRDIEYTYDGVDNVLTRNERYKASNNAIVSVNDTYSYDSFDRLTRDVHSRSAGTSKTNSYSYDIHGNILWKSNAGTMTYDSANRLKTLSGGMAGSRQYTYDANGNVKSDSKRTYQWTAFNKPSQIRQGTKRTNFTYDANNNRIKQDLSIPGKNETTYYLGKTYEYVIRNDGLYNTTTQAKHHIYAGKEVVAIQIRTTHNNAKQPDVTRYLHKDALGNIDTITDANGKIVQRAEYEPFGKQTVTLNQAEQPWTNRGYTGHEHLTDFGLIHMNARIYDPTVGRFLSADTFIQAVDNSQSYNRYAYVINNPLKYTDPSGHFWFLVAFFVVAAVVTDIPILDTIASVVVGIAMNIAFPGLGFAMSFMKGAAAGFVGGLASGGGLKGALRGALFGGLSAGIANSIGHGFDGVGSSPFGKAVWLAHGITQGAITELRGGSFKSGFIGAIAGHVSGIVSKGITGIKAGAIATRTAIASVFGGLASRASGGSFRDGAISAAFVHLFNDEVGKRIAKSTAIVKKARSEFARLYKKGLLPKEYNFIENLKGGINNPTLRFRYVDKLSTTNLGNMGEMDIYDGTGGFVLRYGATDIYTAVYVVAHEIAHAIPVNVNLWVSGKYTAAENSADSFGASVLKIWKNNRQ